jgi:hypothetical protein
MEAPLLNEEKTSWSIRQPKKVSAALRPDALTGIIFGCRTQKPQMDFIDKLLAERAALGAPAVKTYVVAQHPTKYRLVIRRR